MKNVKSSLKVSKLNRIFILYVKNKRTIQDPVIKGKIWRSLDLANQSHTSINSQNITSTVTTVTSTVISSTTSIHHNSLINYQRHDFKNRRSSSEPANEQKLLAHIPNNTTINQNTNNTKNSSSLVISDATSSVEPSDDLIECLHQKNIKVSKIRNCQPPPFCLLIFYQFCLSFSHTLFTVHLILFFTVNIKKWFCELQL